MNVLQIAIGFIAGLLIGRSIVAAADFIHDTYRRRTL